MKRIEIEGVGLVDFPDSMTDAEITAAIENEILKTPTPTNIPKQKSALSSIGDTITGAVESLNQRNLNEIAAADQQQVSKSGIQPKKTGFNYKAAESMLPSVEKSRQETARINQIGSDVQSGFTPAEAAQNAFGDQVIQAQATKDAATAQLQSDAKRETKSLLKDAKELTEKPKRSIGDVYGDLANTALKVAPTAIEMGAEAADFITLGAVDLGVKKYLEQGLAGMDDMFGSDALKYEKEEFADLQDTTDFGDKVQFLLRNPMYMVDAAGTSMGSMAIPVGTSMAILRIAGAIQPGLTIKTARALQGGTFSGTVALQNAASTFNNEAIADLPDSKKYEAAAMTAILTLATNKVFGGGLDKVIADRVGKYANKTGLDVILKESGQEFGESASQSFAVDAVAPDRMTFEQGINQAATEGLLGAVGGGLFKGVDALTSNKDKLIISGENNAADDATAERLQAEYDAKQQAEQEANAALAGIQNAQSVEDAALLANEALKTPLTPSAPEAIPATDILGEENEQSIPAVTALADAAIKSASNNTEGSVGTVLSEPERAGVGTASGASIPSIGADLPAGTAGGGNNAVNRPFATASDSYLEQMRTMTIDETIIKQIDEEVAARSGNVQNVTVDDLAGENINNEWVEFKPETGTLAIPRDEMPQIKAEHRGAMVNFLNAREIEHQQETIPASDLKPTQLEFSSKKVEKAKSYEGGNRSILISSDNHVLDGHHQWLASLDKGENIDVIRLNAPINQLLNEIKDFPSATTADGTPLNKTTLAQNALNNTNTPEISSENVIARVGVTPRAAEPVTIRNGVIYVGNEPAVNFETGEDVVAKGSTFDDVKKALSDAGVLSSRQKVFSVGKQSDQQAPNIETPKEQKPKATKPYKPKSLLSTMKELGGIALSEKQDVTGETRGFAPGGYNQIFKSASTRSLKGLIESGDLDDYLPYNMRLSASTMNDDAYDSTEAYDYLADRIRNGEQILPYEVEEEARNNQLYQEQDATADADVELAADLLTEDEINEQLKIAGNAEREAAAEAKIPVTESEDGDTGSSTGTQEGAETNTSQQAEVTQTKTDLLGEDTRAKQALADAERAKDAKRNSGTDNQDTFTLTGSNSEADQAAAAGAQDLFADQLLQKQLNEPEITAEEKMRQAFRNIDGYKLNEFYPITVTHNEKTQNFLARVIKSYTEGNPVIYFVQVEFRSPIKGAPKEYRYTQYKLDRNNKLTEDSVGKASDILIDKWRNSGFADPAQPQDEVTKAAEALTEAGVTGKERLDTIKDVRQGNLTADEVAEAYAADQQDEPSAPATITDFGEKLEGAKKDLWQNYKKAMTDKLPDDLSQVTLAKYYPEPDYDNLIASGLEIKAIAAIKAMRDEVPSKPRMSAKVRRWAANLDMLRQFASGIIDGTYNIDQVFSMMREKGSLSGFVDRIELYAELGYPAMKSAKGYSVSTGWTDLRGDGRTVSLELPNGRREFYRSREDAVEALRNKLESAPEGTERKTKLDVYKVTRTGEVMIGKKVASNKYIDLKGGFKTGKEAFQYYAENEAQLLELLEQRKTLMPERRSTNNPRIGIDYRLGEDVTPEKFAAEFGFRGVQFGNYVEQSRRSRDLNNAYDALLDLANIIGVPPRAISLNGTLGLAFGARGSGGKNAAAAHYERDQVVINLTKVNGFGSLGHEWFHALDNYFSKMRGENEYLTQKPTQKRIYQPSAGFADDTSIRTEVLDAFKNLMDGIRNSAYYTRSAQRDNTRTKDYWSTSEELAARAFEAYLIAKSKEAGRENDYLANIEDEDVYEIANQAAKDFGGFEDPYPYPTREEQKIFNPLFDALFANLQSKETETGGIAIYQDKAQYDVYETDLFSNPIQTRSARSGAGKVAPNASANQVSETGIQDTEAPNAEYFVNTIVGTEQNKTLGAAVINSSEQLAQATRYLNKAAVEKLDGVITDINGKPLAVIGGFKGAPTQAAVYPATLVAEAVRVPGAANLWLSHNHPSGEATLSNADKTLYQNLKNVFDGSGISVKSLIAVTKNEYASIDDEGEQALLNIPEAKSFSTVPVIERELQDNGARGGLISSPSIAKVIGKEFYEKAQENGIILSDSQNRIVGWVPLSDKLIGNLKNTGGLNSLYRAISQSNAVGAFIVHNGDLSQPKFENGQSVVENIGRALKNIDVSLLDAINVTDNTTAAEKGDGIIGDVLFSRSQPRTPFVAQQDENYLPTLNNVIALFKSGNRAKQQEAGKTPVPISRTPVVLRQVIEDDGSKPFKRSDFVVGQGSTLYLKADNVHSRSIHSGRISKDVLDRLPQLLADPIAVFKSSPSSEDSKSFKVLLDATDEKGDPVIVAIKPNVPMQQLNNASVNFQATIFPATWNKVREWNKDGLLRYYNEKSPRTGRPANNPLGTVSELSENTREGLEASQTSVVPSNPGEAATEVGARESFDANIGVSAAKVKVVTKGDIENMPEAAFSRSDAPIFYSQLSRAISEAKQDSMPAKQWTAWLTANAGKLGIKKDELQWTGVNEWLELQTGKVGKADILAYLDGNGVQVEEVLLADVQTDSYNPSNYNNLPSEMQELVNQVDDGEVDESDFASEAEKLGYKVDLDLEGNVESIYKIGSGYAPTKYAKYTVPGGKNYKELLLTLPSEIKATNLKDALKAWKEDARQGLRGIYEPSEIENMTADMLTPILEEEYLNQPTKKGYKSSHFDQANILAHVRFDERTDADGKRVLFIQEVQSDWGQAGKKTGFAKFDVVQNEDGEWVFNLGNGTTSTYPAARFNSLKEAKAYAKENGLKSYGVPDAPFVTDTKAWVSLALKRMMRYAVDNGFDKVAIINGQQAADLYDLSKQVDSVTAIKNLNGTFAVFADQDNRNVFDKDNIKAEDLQDIIGKELAEKISTQKGNKPVKYEGIDLKVGGEGMLTFYDQIVPQVANDVLRKVGGGKVEPVQIASRNIVNLSEKEAKKLYRKGEPVFFMDDEDSELQVEESDIEDNEEFFSDYQFYTYSNEAARDQVGFTITPEMREKVAAGVPLFKRDAPISGMPTNSVQSVVDALRKNWTAAPEIIVVESMQDSKIPQAVRAENDRQLSQGATGEPEGFYYKGSVYVLSSQMNSAKDIERVVLHETLGHFGLRKTFGKELESILKQLAVARTKDVKDKAASYGLDPAKESDRLIAAEEVLAEMAQNNPQAGFVKRAIAAIRNWLRKHGFNLQLTDNDIVVNYLLPARAYVEKGGESGVSAALVPSFSRADQTKSPEFKAWFGDSKVVDADGKPLVVYHGTTSDISIFDPNRTKSSEVIFTTPNQESASNYAETKWDNGAPNVMPLYVSIKTPAYIDASEYSFDKLQSAVSRGNVDGVLVIDDSGKIVIAAPFDAKQIKSAIGNNGNFDPNNPDIRFSRSNPQQRLTPEWKAPDASKFDSVVYALQDKHVDLKRVTQAIKDAGNEISDRWNAYLQEELYHGRTAKRTQEFIKNDLDPLIQDMRMRGVAMADFEEYLWMRHAEERNDQIAKVNPNMPDGGSGVKTQDARDYLENLSPTDKAKYEALARRIDLINQKSRQVLLDYGLESADTIAAWEGAYQHYVPLMREDMELGFGNGTGQGFSVKGNSSKRATGSNRAVVDIIANIAQQYERNIIRGEKNRVATALIGLAKLNPNDDFWQVDTPPTVKDVNKTTGLVEERTDPNYKNRPNVVVARIPNRLGKIQERSVIFNQFDERAMRMAASIKNLDQDQMNHLLGIASGFTRYFASINTQYNPIFGVINITRDVQGALLNLSSTHIADKKKEVLANTPKALRGIYQDLRKQRKSGEASLTQWAQLFEEFQLEGGQTGYRNMYANAKDRSEALRDALNPEWWKESKIGKFISVNGLIAQPEQWMYDKAIKPIFDWLSDYNNALENAVRLSVYKASLDAGQSKQQAASIAKNISVNFNRKGSYGREIGSLYAFFNASVQGTARIGETMLKRDSDTGKLSLSKAGKVIMQGGLLLGAMQALLLAAAGYDEKDPPQFVRDRSLIIPLDPFGADGKFVTIPMPLGFNAIPAVGRRITEWALAGGEDTPKRIIGMMDMILDVTNPIGNAGLSLQTITPTIIDPFAALAENKDFTGRPISRDDFSSLNPTPGFTRSRDKAWDFSVAIARGLNWATGGSDATQGAISPTADQLEYLAGQFTGGVGRETIKLGTTVNALTTGEDLPTYKIPLFGRFFGDVKTQSSQGAEFYNNVQRLNEHQAEIKLLQENDGDLDAYLEENPEALYFRQADRVYRNITKLRKNQRVLKENGADKSEIKAIDEAITELMKNFNDEIKAAKEKEPA